MDDTTATVTPDAPAPDEVPLTLPVIGDDAAPPEQPAEPEPQAEEDKPEGEPAAVQPWDSERYKEDEGFHDWNNTQLKQAERRGQKRESGQRRNTEALHTEVKGAIQSLNSTFQQMVKGPNAIDAEMLREALDNNAGLNYLKGWTEDQRQSTASQGLAYGLAAAFAGLGAHKYGDPEAANALAQSVLENASHEVFSKLGADGDTVAMTKEIADQLDDLLQPMISKARQEDRDEIASLKADIETGKSESRANGADLTVKTPSGTKSYKTLAAAQAAHAKGEINNAKMREIRAGFIEQSAAESRA